MISIVLYINTLGLKEANLQQAPDSVGKNDSTKVLNQCLDTTK